MVHIEADQIVIATGGHPFIPDVVAHAGVDFHTSDTIMWIDELPASMVILGGGSVAAEFAHVFSSLGVQIHIVTKPRRWLETLSMRKSLGASLPKWRDNGTSTSAAPSPGFRRVPEVSP